MSVAKAITIKSDKAQELYALAKSALMVVIVLELVSLIGGVVRPMLAEW